MDGLAISPFIASLPKVELHIHIEGTLQPALRWKLAHRNNVPLPYATYDALLASYAVTLNHRPELHGRQPGVPTFLEAYFAGCEVLRTEDDFYELAMDYLARCRAMNVRYCEPFFDVQAHTRRGVPAAAVLDGYLRAQRDGAARYGVRSRWIFCFLRDEPVADGLAAYEAARPWSVRGTRGGGRGTSADGKEKEEEEEGEEGQGEGEGEGEGKGLGAKGLFHAVGLASNAFERPPLLFEEGFRRARDDDGLHVTMHCDFGQKDTHAHLREAVFLVCGGAGAERIDHGLDAEDDPALLAGLRERGIGLTLCPHAYHRRTATEVLFPRIRRLWESGVKFCINSDDPVYMPDVWIDGNMEKVYHYCQLGKRDMVQLVRNAVEMSWAGDDVKEEILEELKAFDTE